MVSLTALWLPIILAAVIVFLASSIMHVVLTYHQSDCKQIPDGRKCARRDAGRRPEAGLLSLPFC